MGRGKSLRTHIKREILATRATAIAVEEAAQVIYQKNEAKKPLTVSVREHIGKMIDRIDPIETGVILASTVLLHDTVDWTASVLRDKLGRMRAGTTILGIERQAGTTMLGQIGIDIASVPEPEKWLLSFVCAYFLVKNAGKITGSIQSFVVGLMGVV